jgi:signal transduction histidine kinase/ligand-binding sensor domain-containing protein
MPRLRVCAAFGLAVLAAAAPVHALDPQRANSQYVLTKWAAASLGSNGVNAILQTPDHYLWLGTSAGLVRFDGARFAVVNRNTPDFGDGGVSSLACAPDGTLYFGTVSGTVHQYKDGAFTRLPMNQGTGDVLSLVQARDGGLWISLLGRPVYRFKDGRSSTLINQADDRGRSIDDNGPLGLIEDANGVLWIGTRNRGLVRHEGDRFTRLPLTSDTIQALRADRTGALWIGTPHGLLKYEDGKTRVFTRKDGLSNDSVSAILDDRDGNLWVGTAGGGLNRLTNGRFTRLTTQEGLSDDDVRSLLEDHEGNLWVGTGDGLNCLSEGRFTSYGKLEAQRDLAVTAVAPGADGTVWMGTKSSTVARLRDGRFEHWALPGGLGRETIIALHEDRQRTLWIGVENGQLFRIKDGVITEETPIAQPREAQSQWKIPVFLEDDGGPLFFVTAAASPGQGRFMRIANRHATPLGDHPLAAPGPRFGYPHDAYVQPDGTLWMGASNGLGMLRNGVWKRYTDAEGLPHNRVRSISPDPDGGLWLATGQGLAYFKNGVVQKVSTQQGLPESFLRLVLDDGLGHLWLASRGRIFRVDKQELRDLFAGKLAHIAPVEFDISDGLRTTEGVLSNSPGFRAPDGRLWFATSKGVSVVDPRKIDTLESAPQVRIESMNIDGRAADLQTRAEYPPGRGEVTIEYTALSLAAPSKVRFRHRLHGIDDDWVEADGTRVAHYRTLPPGTYRFSVTACNRDGVWNGGEATIAFSILPPFYQRTWFYAGCVAALAGIVALVHRVRVNQMRERFAAIIDERTRIARELHDTLAQGLAAVGIQLDTALSRLPDEPALGRVHRHMQLARSMVRSSLNEVRRSIWVLRAQTSKAANGLSISLQDNLSQLTADSGVSTTLHVTGQPRPLPSEIERSLLRIAHEAVTNAVRHAAAKHVTVDLHFDAERIHLRVRDDGCGFDPEAAREKTRGKNFGLVGISERARSMGGQLVLDSRPGAGTAIECHLPYECRVETANTEGIEGVSL